MRVETIGVPNRIRQSISVFCFCSLMLLGSRACALRVCSTCLSSSTDIKLPNSWTFDRIGIRFGPILHKQCIHTLKSSECIREMRQCYEATKMKELACYAKRLSAIFRKGARSQLSHCTATADKTWLHLRVPENYAKAFMC